MLMNPWSARRYLRLSAFDSSTEQGRTAERYRMAAWSVLANIASKGMSLVVMVTSVGAPRAIRPRAKLAGFVSFVR